MKQLQREMDRARRTHAELVVTFVDVDGLKKVNDTEGHLAGDSLLLAVGVRDGRELGENRERQHG